MSDLAGESSALGRVCTWNMRAIPNCNGGVHAHLHDPQLQHGSVNQQQRGTAAQPQKGRLAPCLQLCITWAAENACRRVAGVFTEGATAAANWKMINRIN